MKEQQAAKKAVRDAKIAELKKKEEAAKTKEEKETIAEEREARRKEYVEPDVSAHHGRSDGHHHGQAVRCLLLTLRPSPEFSSMCSWSFPAWVSCGCREWARRLALGVAWLKILRWVAITVVTLVVIVPITAETTQKMFQEIEKQTKAKSGGGAAPFPMAALGQFTAIATAVTSVVSALFASIYPALSLWFLTRPATRAAFLARAKPAGPPLELEPGEPS